MGKNISEFFNEEQEELAKDYFLDLDIFSTPHLLNERDELLKASNKQVFNEQVSDDNIAKLLAVNDLLDNRNSGIIESLLDQANNTSFRGLRVHYLLSRLYFRRVQDFIHAKLHRDIAMIIYDDLLKTRDNNSDKILAYGERLFNMVFSGNILLPSKKELPPDKLRLMLYADIIFDENDLIN